MLFQPYATVKERSFSPRFDVTRREPLIMDDAVSEAVTVAASVEPTVLSIEDTHTFTSQKRHRSP